jgi:hypothetical protein
MPRLRTDQLNAKRLQSDRRGPHQVENIRLSLNETGVQSLNMIQVAVS